ncbi:MULTISPECIES: hypothetical protein [unclassified Microbacterium]|uniref:hypothetical protein n=1 Tax=unclassified Microbacterium TaxID=2609290 RepID=UPI0021572927|nr:MULTISPECIES: hypothetical protein [unclassified Microbacterium]
MLSENTTAPHAGERMRGGVLLVAASVTFLGIAGLLAFYLLPVGFGLTGPALGLAQVGAILLGAALVISSTITVRRHLRRRAALISVAEALGWAYRADIGDRIWGGSIDEQIDRGSRTARDHLDALQCDLPFDSVERTFVVGDREGATMHTVRAVRIPLPSEAPRITLRSGAAAERSACSPAVRTADPGSGWRATSATSSMSRCRPATRPTRSTCSRPT